MRNGLCMVLLLCAACTKSTGPDPGAHPQGDQRDRLTTKLTDLNFIPPPRSGYVLTHLVFSRFFSDRVEPMAIFRHLANAKDSAPGARMVYDEVVAYTWNGDTKTFDERAVVPVFPVDQIFVRDVTHDGLSDIVLFVEFEPWLGMSIIGCDSLHKDLVVRYSSDTSRPLMVRAPDSTAALIMYDSLATGDFEGYIPAIPRRFYRLNGERYVERAFDPAWSIFIQHVRDSTHEAYLFERQLLSEERMTIQPVHEAFTRALIAESLLDSNWDEAVSRINNDLAAPLATRMTSSEVRVVMALRDLPLAASYVGWCSQRADEAAVIAMNAMDDILLGHSPQNMRAALHYAESNVRSPHLWEQLSNAIVAASSDRDALVELQRYLSLRISSDGVSARDLAALLRAQAAVDFRLGSWQDAKGLFIQALSFDSTSANAIKAKQMLTKYW